MRGTSRLQTPQHQQGPHPASHVAAETGLGWAALPCPGLGQTLHRQMHLCVHLGLVQGGDTGQDLALQQLQGGTAAGGDVGHLQGALRV